MVEDDDHFGQFAQLSPEGLLQWHPESPAVQGYERDEIGEVGFDRGESLQETLRKTDRTVVVHHHLPPDKVQLRTGGCPLGQKNRLANTRRRRHKGEGIGESPSRLSDWTTPVWHRERVGASAWSRFTARNAIILLG